MADLKTMDLKDIIPHIETYSRTAQHDMMLCLQFGLKEKEQYANARVLEELESLIKILLNTNTNAIILLNDRKYKLLKEVKQP
jgi:hypothetical protein